MRTYGKISWAIVTVCAFLVIPALAGTQYLEGSPLLSASVSGTNEFSPGDEVKLSIVIDNAGINELKFVQPQIVNRDDLPNTAKFLMAALGPGDAPLKIKSDPQMLGDVKGAGSVTAVFTTEINADAPAGNYTIPLTLDYSYLYLAEQFGFDTIQYTYKHVTEDIGIPIKIKPDISIDVISAIPEHLNVGTEGYLSMKIRNTGSDDGTKAIVKILQNDNSPIVPVDSSVYIGDFPSGSTVECRYKVSISGNADRQTYPIDVEVVYKNNDGDLVTTRSDTVGIPVGSRVDFEVISPSAEMNPGSRKDISVEYKNTGETTIYSAQSRISAVDPFTSNDDVAYLGDLRPGESVVASYEVSVDRTATIKEYGLDSEIRYQDALGNTYISDTMKVRVNVKSLNGLAAVFSNPLYLSIIIAGIIGIIYLVYHYRKKG
jgi:hypothetical protein